MPVKSRSAAILEGKCPRCRQGDIFVGSIAQLTRFARMHPFCKVCGLQFEREPGFFIGAMYISYAFSVAIFATVGVALSVLGDYPLYYYFIAIIAATLLLFPVMFRYSRILYLYMFGGVDFDPKYGN